MLCPAPTSSNAQGFLQSLFGGGHQARPRMMPPRRGFNARRYSPHNQNGPWWQYRQSRPHNRTGRFTAMCVRMCDGYYWPMSDRTSRGKFYDLARRCEDSCNTEAKLFYLPAYSRDVRHMTDLTGRAYEHIDTAFLYRKKLVKSCSCKPMPWSYSAKAKHMRYAAREAEKRTELAKRKQLRDAASATIHQTHPLGGDDGDSGVIDAPGEVDTNFALESEQEARRKAAARRTMRRRRSAMRTRRMPRNHAMMHRRIKRNRGAHPGFGAAHSGNVGRVNRQYRRRYRYRHR